MARNYMSFQYFFYVALSVTFFKLVLVIQVFFVKPWLHQPPLLLWLHLSCPSSSVFCRRPTSWGPTNCCRGAVLWYWGGVTSTILKCFAHLSYLKFTWGPCHVSVSPRHVVLIPLRRVFVVALITLELIQISVSLGNFGNFVVSTASSSEMEI